jgi:type IV secretion system protein VirB1
MAIDTAAQATVAAIATVNGKNASTAREPALPAPSRTANSSVAGIDLSALAAPTAPKTPEASASTANRPSSATGNPPRDNVFVPEVHGPGDPPDIAASPGPVVTAGQAGLLPVDTDNADPHQEQRDAAFVF